MSTTAGECSRRRARRSRHPPIRAGSIRFAALDITESCQHADPSTSDAVSIRLACQVAPPAYALFIVGTSRVRLGITIWIIQAFAPEAAVLIRLAVIVCNAHDATILQSTYSRNQSIRPVARVIDAFQRLGNWLPSPDRTRPVFCTTDSLASTSIGVTYLVLEAVRAVFALFRAPHVDTDLSLLTIDIREASRLHALSEKTADTFSTVIVDEALYTRARQPAAAWNEIN